MKDGINLAYLTLVKDVDLKEDEHFMYFPSNTWNIGNLQTVVENKT